MGLHNTILSILWVWTFDSLYTLILAQSYDPAKGDVRLRCHSVVTVIGQKTNSFGSGEIKYYISRCKQRITITLQTPYLHRTNIIRPSCANYTQVLITAPKATSCYSASLTTPPTLLVTNKTGLQTNTICLEVRTGRICTSRIIQPSTLQHIITFQKRRAHTQDTSVNANHFTENPT